jgi:hemerythrin superfamily protein
MATRTQSRSKQSSKTSRRQPRNDDGEFTSRKSNRSSDRSAFSWGDHAGSLIGAAAAGAGLAIAAHFGRKALMQGMEARAGDWEAMLKQDHDEIETLFNDMLATDSSQTFKRSAMLMKLAYKLDKHAYEEESVVYPALREDNDTKQADDLDMEHGHIKTYLYELKQMDADDSSWLETVREFRDLVVEHARMEEQEVFPRFKNDMTEEQNSKLTMMVNKAGFMMA